jgi:S-adenosylmethionine:tRNA ribosyltransferase-isomerase
MKTADFDFDLPDTLIAKYPLKERSASRLMHLPANGPIHHRHFSNLLDVIHPKDCLIFNNSRVIPARLFGEKSTGGKIECLIERLIDDTHATAHIRASKSPKPGTILHFNNALVTVTGRQDDLFVLESTIPFLSLLEDEGHMPLPPYLQREDESSDLERYQTVYAEPKGSVAAPTAGLHFDETLLKKLEEKSIATDFVTLHVGAGTFQPVRTEIITDHHMHEERYSLPASCCSLIQKTKAQGGRVIAVGTTTVRTLESAATQGSLTPHTRDTNIFIYPGFQFKIVDAMITNFHLPRSSLLMLVSAFSGKEKILDAYQTAINEHYRFYSYGDAMFLERE